MNVISLVIDRLHIGHLGCYGNSWVEAPNFDRLAADGFVFDQALIESPHLAGQYAAYTSGVHGAARATGQPADADFIRRLQAAGIATALITDDPDVADLPWAAELDEVVRVDVQRTMTPVDEIEQSNLARFFAVVGQWLEGAPQPFCLWVHCGSLGFTWDAPLEMRERYADEDEPAPATDAVVPCRLLPEGFDPDELLAASQAYAGQVSLLDVCLGALLVDLDQLSLAKRTLLSLVSARGFPLGEHRRLGPVDEALYAEVAHVPWLLRLPDGAGAADRSQQLAQPADLAPTLLEALGLSTAATEAACANGAAGRSLLSIVRGESDVLRDRALLIGAGQERAVRTPAWFMRVPHYQTATAEKSRELAVELYAKPDDRWEVNDVADRCPQVVELLTEVLDAGLAASTEAPAPLAEVLLAGLD